VVRALTLQKCKLLRMGRETAPNRYDNFHLGCGLRLDSGDPSQSWKELELNFYSSGTTQTKLLDKEN